MKGLIIKNQNGYFTIAGPEGATALARSRGRTKRKGSILVGDWVEYEQTKDSAPSIVSVYPRINELHRPPIANINQLVLTVAAENPDPSLFMIDKMLVLAEYSRIPGILLCINKADLNPEYAEQLQTLYEKAGYPCIAVSAIQEKGISQLKEALSGPVISFSGPSGVGKSTLLNHILGREQFAHQAVSQHTGRGRNTTRHSELVRLMDSLYVMDTPGYTSLDLDSQVEDGLDYLFRDFRLYLGQCRFNNCRHLKEPGCAISRAVDEGCIAQSRYTSYVSILNEIKNRIIRY